MSIIPPPLLIVRLKPVDGNIPHDNPSQHSYRIWGYRVAHGANWRASVCFPTMCGVSWNDGSRSGLSGRKSTRWFLIWSKHSWEGGAGGGTWSAHHRNWIIITNSIQIELIRARLLRLSIYGGRVIAADWNRWWPLCNLRRLNPAIVYQAQVASQLRLLIIFRRAFDWTACPVRNYKPLIRKCW